MKKYIKPEIRVKNIEIESAILAASRATTGDPINDVGQDVNTDEVDAGQNSLSKPSFMDWDEE